MGKKGIKKYIRVCTKYHAQFEGYKLPVGVYYGRSGNTFFVLSDGNTDGNFYRVDIMTEKNPEWHKGKVLLESEIGREISALIREKGNPKKGKYNREIGVNNASRLEPYQYKGNKYWAFPYEMPIADAKVDKDIRETGDCPHIRKPQEPNLTRGRRIRETENESENSHESFIKDSVVIANEDSYWKTGEDVPRRN